MSEFIDLAAITRRLREVINNSGLTAKDFATRAGIAPATLSLNLNERQLINVVTINKIIEHYPELVDPYWFLFGAEGGQLPRPALPSPIDTSEGDETERFRTILISQAEEIARLKAELEGRRSKEIDHITVFYTDNSFSSFHSDESQS